MIRPHRNAFVDCTLTEAVYGALVREWLEASGEDGAAPPASLGLGRLVSYPWLSEALARAASVHPAWDGKKGRASEGDPNRLVASILSSPALLDRLGSPFVGSGYRVSGISVEKVLVGPAAEHCPGGADPRALLPIDAQVWLMLERDR